MSNTLFNNQGTTDISDDPVVLAIQEAVRAFKAGSESYAALIAEQGTNLEDFIKAARQQLNDARAAHAARLETLEAEFLHRRADLLSSQRDEFNAILAEIAAEEAAAVNERQSLRSAALAAADEARATAAENERELVQRLSAEVGALEAQLQQARATYLLNSDKLAHNLQILSARDDENNATIAQQRRQLARLHSLLCSTQTKTIESTRALQQRNEVITAELRRTSSRQHALGRAAVRRSGEAARRYERLWQMRENQAVQTLETLLDRDRAIFTEILGVPWSPPVAATVENEQINSTNTENEEVQSEISNSEAVTRLISLIPSMQDLISDVGQSSNSAQNQPAAASETAPPSEIRRYWSDLANVLPESRAQTYAVLRQRMGQHLAALRRRSSLLEATERLESENEELRQVLGMVESQTTQPMMQNTLGAGAKTQSVQLEHVGERGVRVREMA